MKDYCIILTCDQGYVEPALFLVNQLSRDPNKNYDILICSGQDLSLFSTDAKVKTIKIDTETFTDSLPKSARLKEYTYWRIPAIEHLAKSYQKILYLDIDIYMNGHTVADIFEIPMKGAPLAAVRDVHQRTRASRIPNEFKLLGLKNRAYFNAGVLLIDCKSWLKNSCFKKIITYKDKSPESLLLQDQSLLNLVFYNNWLELSPSWNWQYGTKLNFFIEIIGSRFIHFAGENKLWDHPNTDIPKPYWDIYQQFLIKYNLQTKKTKYPNISDKSYAKKIKLMLFKNLYYFKRHVKYFSQFKDEFDTIHHQDISKVQDNLPSATIN